MIALAIDEIYNPQHKPTEGERVLEILQKTGFIGSLPDVEDLSVNYKDYSDLPMRLCCCRQSIWATAEF
ncbi:MAG: hypothetical protein ACU837_15350 [Gammaproteobacteria bacterium]